MRYLTQGELSSLSNRQRYSDILIFDNVKIGEEGDTCPSCDGWMENELAFALDTDCTGPWYCATCWDTANGFEPWDWERYDHESGYCECESCEEERYASEDEYDPYGESTEDDPTTRQSPLHIPELPNRPIRLTSLEIEVGMGGSYLAEQYHAAGQADSPYMGGYHEGSNGAFMRVEEDCSVAGELIFDRMRLSDPDVAGQFEDGLSILRQAISDGRSKLDMRCGLHIHVGINRDGNIPGYSPTDLTSLYHLWNYLEDSIFRLGSANWNGHRSEHGNDYAPKTRKGLNEGRQYDSRGSLNFGNYLYAMRDCECEWEDCECGYGTPTVEFRVFNTSANARKIRAYVALTQAMVAAAQQHIFTPDIFPPMEWTCMSEPDMRASMERMQFILERLPLTDEERDDLRYCFDRSSLKEAYANMDSQTVLNI